jgi:hypothetical protein
MLELRHPCVVEFLGSYCPDAAALRAGRGIASGFADDDQGDAMKVVGQGL